VSPLHPDGIELEQLLEGEVTENRALELRAHLRACPACTGRFEGERALLGALSEELDGLPAPDALDRLMARVDEDTRGSDPRPRARRWLRWPVVAGIAAAAAAVLAVIVPLRGPREAHVAARGAEKGWSAKVGVELLALGDPPRRLLAGAEVTRDVAFTAAYRNRNDAPAYLLAYAIDAAGEVHWLYPGYLSTADDPAAVRLDPTAGDAVLPDAVVLDDPAPGPLRCVVVVTREPLRVSAIERLSPEERQPSRLRQRWPDASVTSLDLVVVTGGGRP
jgi:hypothetical protein